MRNLWPTLESIDYIQTPKDILKEQASYLEKNTGGILQGKVQSQKIDRDQSPSGFSPSPLDNDLFVHSFYIFASKLNYSFTLLTITHQVVKIYPCELDSDLAGTRQVSANSQAELEDMLSKIFQHPSVVDSITSLILQSKGEKAKEKRTYDDDLPF